MEYTFKMGDNLERFLPANLGEGEVLFLRKSKSNYWISGEFKIFRKQDILDEFAIELEEHPVEDKFIEVFRRNYFKFLPDSDYFGVSKSIVDKTLYVGQEVYNKRYFKDRLGKIISINPNEEYGVFVKFEGIPCKFNFEGVVEDGFGRESTLTTVCLQENFKERKTPDYSKAMDWLRNEDLFPDPVVESPVLVVYQDKEDKQAQEAFHKLLLLRDYYNGDRNPGTYIYCICNIGGAVCAHTTQSVRHVLAFKDPETRDLFLKEQKDLILTAKNLI